MTAISVESLGEWEAWVAIGTILLATATAYLALQTRGQAGETKRLAQLTEREVEAVRAQADAAQAQLAAVRDQAEAAQEGAAAARAAVEAGTRPILVDAPPDAALSSVGTEEALRALPGMLIVNHTAEGLTCRVPARNVGPGVAMIVTTALRAGDLPAWSGIPVRSVVQPGENTILQFGISRTDPHGGRILDAVQGQRNFSVETLYTDAAGGQRTMTRFDLYYVDGRGWRVTQVHLCDPATGVAYASSGPGF